MEKIIYKLQITGIVSGFINNLVSKGLVRNYDKDLCLNLFCTYSEYDIPIGVRFDHLKSESSNMFFKTNAILIDVTQGWGLPFDSIPKGHKTICRFEFSKDDLAIVKKEIPVVDSWENSDYKFDLLKYE